MSEEEDEYDLKRIAIIAGLIIASAIVVTVVFGIVDIELPEFDFENFEKQIEPNENINQEDLKFINNDYEKYLDFGISSDDIINFQNMDCSFFETEELISKDPIYEEIVDQRRNECS